MEERVFPDLLSTCCKPRPKGSRVIPSRRSRSLCRASVSIATRAGHDRSLDTLAAVGVMHARRARPPNSAYPLFFPAPNLISTSLVSSLLPSFFLASFGVWPQTLACFILIAGALRVDFCYFFPIRLFSLVTGVGAFWCSLGCLRRRGGREQRRNNRSAREER